MEDPPQSADGEERGKERVGPGSCAQSIDSELYPEKRWHPRVTADLLRQPRLAAVRNRAGRSHCRRAHAGMLFMRSTDAEIEDISWWTVHSCSGATVLFHVAMLGAGVSSK